jgi:hypothetical protein
MKYKKEFIYVFQITTYSTPGLSRRHHPQRFSQKLSCGFENIRKVAHVDHLNNVS